MAGTGIRNRHRVGFYLVQDDESGFVMYNDEVARIWNGTYRRIDQYESRQPQEFVKARKDPKALVVVRPEDTLALPTTAELPEVGESGVTTPTGPASHLFNPGIGEMRVGFSFVIR